MCVDECRRQITPVGGDLLGALRELCHQALPDAVDLETGSGRVAPAARLPAHPERTGQHIRQDTLVELGQRRGRFEQGPAVEGPPPAVG